MLFVLNFRKPCFFFLWFVSKDPQVSQYSQCVDNIYAFSNIVLSCAYPWDLIEYFGLVSCVPFILEKGLPKEFCWTFSFVISSLSEIRGIQRAISHRQKRTNWAHSVFPVTLQTSICGRFFFENHTVGILRKPLGFDFINDFYQTKIF